uniref:Uncharacterized protein n=1 Tax=Glossina palpalis gambiensis TaxID=67801 RepID=A0A1B0BU01_9MUSC
SNILSSLHFLSCDVLQSFDKDHNFLKHRKQKITQLSASKSAKYGKYFNCVEENNSKGEERCLTCLNLYKDLNSYFISLDKRYIGKVCFEMQNFRNSSSRKNKIKIPLILIPNESHAVNSKCNNCY